jgi:hypothetical protein
MTWRILLFNLIACWFVGCSGFTRGMAFQQCSLTSRTKRIIRPIMRVHALILRAAFASVMLVVIAAAGSFGNRPVMAIRGSLQGDVDCSYSVDGSDALLSLGSQAGLSVSAPCMAGAGDVDCSGEIDVKDVVQILAFAAAEESGATTLGASCQSLGEEITPPPTSEKLIADALAANTIDLDTSLLYRAYALENDPALPEAYRSEVPQLGALTELAIDVRQNEGDLSQATKEALTPYLARPADPASIFYRDQVSAQVSTGWTSQLTADGLARVWVNLANSSKLGTAATVVGDIWKALYGPSSLIHKPIPDTTGATAVNPDAAIDVYFVDLSVTDPRYAACRDDPSLLECFVPALGAAVPTAPFSGDTASAYIVVDAGVLDVSREVSVAVLSDNLFRASQFSYDVLENKNRWLPDATAMWGVFRVLQKLGDSQLVPFERLPRFFRDVELTTTRRDGGSIEWPFFLYASMEKGDGIVDKIWKSAAAAGVQGIAAVDMNLPLEENFPKFALRNWNQDYLAKTYRDAGTTQPIFPRTRPKRKNIPALGLGDRRLGSDIPALSAHYYEVTFKDVVRSVSFENSLFGTEHAHVWLIPQIDGGWYDPIDVTEILNTDWCRDNPFENLTRLIVVISNSDPEASFVPDDPIVHAKAKGCDGWGGTMTATHIWNVNDPEAHGSGQATSKFTGLWQIFDHGSATDCLSDHCIFYQPKGTIAWTWHSEGPYPTICPSDGSGTVPAGNPTSDIVQELALGVVDDQHYSYAGSGRFQSGFLANCHNPIDSGGTPPPFFELSPDASSNNEPGGDGDTCFTMDWLINIDANKITGSCYRYNYPNNSLMYEWHLVRVGHAIP